MKFEQNGTGNYTQGLSLEIFCARISQRAGRHRDQLLFTKDGDFPDEFSRMTMFFGPDLCYTSRLSTGNLPRHNRGRICDRTFKTKSICFSPYGGNH